MSGTIDNLGLSPRLPNVSSGGMMQNNLTNRVIRNNISINNFKKRTKDSQNQKQLGNWRKRRDIVTKKIGTLSHANRQINDKSTNNNGSNVNNEKMEDHENEEDVVHAKKANQNLFGGPFRRRAVPAVSSERARER